MNKAPDLTEGLLRKSLLRKGLLGKSLIMTVWYYLGLLITLRASLVAQW